MSSRLLLAAVLAVLTGATAGAQEAAQQQSPTFNSATSAVMVDVVVRDQEGRPVLDLVAENFELLEDVHGRTSPPSPSSLRAGIGRTGAPFRR